MSEATKATEEHIWKVQMQMGRFIAELRKRSLAHDKSKLEDPEASMFAIWSPRLKLAEYGSDEYKDALENMGPALQHHYENNRHHPEHFDGGIMDMNLFDILEMLADWKAAGERVKEGSMKKSFAINVDRFDIPPDVAAVLLNTIEYLGWHLN